jgi:predicted transcriptional regulator
MKLGEIVKKLNLDVKSGEARLDSDVSRGYVSDLMSDVIANTNKGDLWITLQVHINVVAVATMKELSGIILINGREPEAVTLEKAKDENIPILISQLPAFEVAGRLYELGITGVDDA